MSVAWVDFGGRENKRVPGGPCMENKSERLAVAAVAMATGPSKSAKHPSAGRVLAHRGDNGGAKPGDLQGPRRLVGSLFQRQLCRETYHQKKSRVLSLSSSNSFSLFHPRPLLGVAEKKVVKLGQRRTSGGHVEYKSRRLRFCSVETTFSRRKMPLN